MVIEFKLIGSEELQQRLLSMGERAINAEPAMLELLGVIERGERALFDSPRWKANAPATIERKGRNAPLVRTGALERSLTESGDPNAIREATHDGLRFGTRLWYAHFALGTQHEPRRTPFPGGRAAFKEEAAAVLGDWVMGMDENPEIASLRSWAGGA